MKKNIVKSLALVMSLTCLCMGFGGCAVKDKMDGWFDKVFAETPSTEDSVDEENKNSSTEDKDDSTNKDDTSTDTSTDEGGEDSTDTSTDSSTGDDSTDSSTDDESGNDTTQDGVNGEGSTVTDFPFFVGDGNAFEDDYVYIMPEKGTCYVGDTFRIRAEAIDGIAPTFNYFWASDDFVEVDQRGNVKAIAAGTAYIGVNFAEESYIVQITVLDVE